MANPNILKDGKGVYTTGDPNSAAALAGKVDYIAVKIGGADGATDAQIRQLQAQLAGSGTQIVIWQAVADQGGVDAVTRYGAVGYIAQGENVSEMMAAAQIGSQIKVPKLIVTDTDLASVIQAFPKNQGWGFSLEYYPNTDPGKNPTNAAGLLNWMAGGGGASFVNVTVGAWNSAQTNYSFDQYQKDLEELKRLGVPVTGVSGYIYNMMSEEQKIAFQNFITKYGGVISSTPTTGTSVPAGAPPTGQPATPTNTTKSPAQPSPTGSTKPIPTLDTPSEGLSRVVGNAPNPSTVPNRHRIPSEGLANINAKTVAPKPAAVKPDPLAGSPPPPANQQLAKAVAAASQDGQDPRWRDNPNWGGPQAETVAAAQKLGISPNDVLEQRPGANGNTILRLANGTYVSLHPDGTTAYAGWWDKSTYDAAGIGGASSALKTDKPVSTSPVSTAPVNPGAAYNKDIYNIAGYNAAGEYVGGMDGTIPPDQLLSGQGHQP